MSDPYPLLPKLVENGSELGGVTSVLSSDLLSEEVGSAGFSKLDKAAGGAAGGAAGAVVTGAEEVDEVCVVAEAILGWKKKKINHRS